MIGVAVPKNVERTLHEFDPRLRLIWNQRRKRFEILERLADGQKHYAHCFFVEVDGKAIYDLGSGDFILRELRSRDARRRFRNDDDFMFKTTDGPAADLERETADFEEETSDEIVKGALDDFKVRRTGVPKRLKIEKA
ncbi:MAG TPA: hypothetical protein VM695_09950 [Phycisphaerae bacterium]|nr:hypothetical protein [Phycisphaerae bacterium]